MVVVCSAAGETNTLETNTLGAAALTFTFLHQPVIIFALEGPQAHATVVQVPSGFGTLVTDCLGCAPEGHTGLPDLKEGVS
jgi:hypothetical protein